MKAAEIYDFKDHSSNALILSPLEGLISETSS